jgi:hypothetical protein
MGNLKIVTEEELPKLKNIYYNFGTKELKVGDSVGVIMVEVDNKTMKIHTFVFDENGCGYILTDKKG